MVVLVLVGRTGWGWDRDERGTDVPAAEVELDDGNKSFMGVVDFGDGQEHFGVAHEASRRRISYREGVRSARALSGRDRIGLTYLVIRSNILRGSSMKVGSTTLLRSAPGRRFAMMCESTAATRK